MSCDYLLTNILSSLNKIIAYRFGSSTEEDLDRHLENKDADNTKKATKAALTCFTHFLLATGRDLNFQTPKALNEVLRLLTVE
jgi:hypothetical protein